MSAIKPGQTDNLSIVYLDADGKPMPAPVPDRPANWTQTNPSVDQLTPSGDTATAKPLAGGTDSIDAVVTVGGKTFTAPPIALTVQGGLQIGVSYETSANNAPSGFKPAIDWAVNFLQSLTKVSATISITFGWGTVGGQALSGGALGSSQGNYSFGDYAATRNALIANGAPGSSTLPAISPMQGTLMLTSSQAKALGFQTGTATDGYVGISSGASWSFAPDTVPPAGSYYAIGTLLHEITEVLGRISLLNYAPYYYGIQDLYRWTSPGVRCLAGGGSGSTAYFSIDNGVTKLATWNNNPSNGDLGDWISGLAGDDANDYGSAGIINKFSSVDVTNMQAIGYYP